MFSNEPNWSDSKGTILIYASCHGRTILHYLRNRRPDLCERFNILRLETGPMTIRMESGMNIFEHEAVKSVFQCADVIFTNNMGARMRHHDLSKVSKLWRQTAKVITFVAPNFSAFWPFCYDGYGAQIGLYNVFDRGVSKDAAWQQFVNGDFDPLFPIRWRMEMGRHGDKERYHDIGLSQFILANHKRAKLQMSASHPSFLTCAYIGSEFCGKLGLPKHSIDEILSWNPTEEAVGGQPETDYEWKHFGFQYPQRHKNDQGGTEYYRKLFDHVYDWWTRSKGTIIPQVD